MDMTIFTLIDSSNYSHSTYSTDVQMASPEPVHATAESIVPLEPLIPTDEFVVLIEPNQNSLTPSQIQWINTAPETRQQNNIRRRLLPNPSRYSARNPLILPPAHDLGKMEHKCQDCGALHFLKEKNARGKYSSCCAGGNVRLPPLSPYPVRFKNLLEGDTAEAKNFRANIRKYNSAMAFASFGYQPAKLSPGIPVVAVHGQVYHITSACIVASDKPKYSQIYFLDPEFATSARMTNPNNTDCLQGLMEELGN